MADHYGYDPKRYDQHWQEAYKAGSMRMPPVRRQPEPPPGLAEFEQRMMAAHAERMMNAV
jgi:hypothetical protein